MMKVFFRPWSTDAYFFHSNAGDIGRHTRQAAMRALQGLLVTCVSLEPSTLTQDNVEKVMCALLKQAVERIDNTRGVAAEIFCFLLHQ